MSRNPISKTRPNYVFFVLYTTEKYTVTQHLLDCKAIPPEVFEIMIRLPRVIDTEEDLLASNDPEDEKHFLFAEEKAKLCGFLHAIDLGHWVTEETKDMYRKIIDKDKLYDAMTVGPQIMPPNTLFVMFTSPWGRGL